jgi:hypothetical protein
VRFELTVKPEGCQIYRLVRPYPSSPLRQNEDNTLFGSFEPIIFLLVLTGDI